VEEAIAYLKGEGIVGAAALGRLPSKANIQTESRILNPESSLHQTCTLLAVNMLKLGLNLSITEAYRKIEDAIKSGAALEKFKQMVEAQGGKWTEEFPKARIIERTTLETLDAYEIGNLVRSLGGGRLKKEDNIDLTVGVKILDRDKKLVEIHKK